MALFYPKYNSGKDLNQNNHINTIHICTTISQDDDDYIYEGESQEVRIKYQVIIKKRKITAVLYFLAF